MIPVTDGFAAPGQAPAEVAAGGRTRRLTSGPAVSRRSVSRASVPRGRPGPRRGCRGAAWVSGGPGGPPASGRRGVPGSSGTRPWPAPSAGWPEARVRRGAPARSASSRPAGGRVGGCPFLSSDDPPQAWGSLPGSVLRLRCFPGGGRSAAGSRGAVHPCPAGPVLQPRCSPGHASGRSADRDRSGPSTRAPSGCAPGAPRSRRCQSIPASQMRDGHRCSLLPASRAGQWGERSSRARAAAKPSSARPYLVAEIVPAGRGGKWPI